MPHLVVSGMGSPGVGGLSTLIVTQGYGGTSQSVCAAFLVVGIQPYDDHLDLTLNSPFNASGPAIEPSAYEVKLVGVGNPVSVLGIVPNGAGSILRVDTSIHTVGASYTLHLPTLGMVSQDGRPFNGPFQINYTGGAGSSVTVQLVRSLDARTIEVVFSRRVNQADAETPANYSVSPTLTVFKATRQSDFHYRLTTDQQVIDQSYDVTISNIRGA